MWFLLKKGGLDCQGIRKPVGPALESYYKSLYIQMTLGKKAHSSGLQGATTGLCFKATTLEHTMLGNPGLAFTLEGWKQGQDRG